VFLAVTKRDQHFTMEILGYLILRTYPTLGTIPILFMKAKLLILILL